MGDYLGLHWQFGVVQNAVASVAAPQNVRIADDDGTTNSITINSNQGFGHGASSVSASTDHDIAHNDDIFVQSGVANVITIKAYGGTQSGGGAITTHDWVLSEVADSAGVSTLGNTTSSSQNYTNGTVSISSGIVRGNQVDIRVRYVGSNGGGSGGNTDFLFQIKGN